MKGANIELISKTFLLSVVLFAGIFLIQLAAVLLLEYLAPGEIENIKTNLNLIHLVFLTWFNFVFLIVVYFIFIFLEKRTLKHIAPSFYFSNFLQIVIAVIIVLILCVVYTGILKFNSKINISFQNPEKIYLIILFDFFTAFSEELVFRGYLLGIFIKQKKIVIGVFLSSFIFAFLHILNPLISVLSFINIFLIGIFLAFMTVWSKNIYFAIAFHFTFNFLDVFLDLNHILVENKHRIWKLEILSTNDLITGGVNGLTGSIILTILLFLFLAFAYLNKERILKLQF